MPAAALRTAATSTLILNHTDPSDPTSNTPTVDANSSSKETVFFDSLQTLIDRAGTAGFLPPGIPQQIGRYRLNRFIGCGGFGLVFEAEDSILQRRVAIKLPKADLVSAPESLKCFLAEARAVSNLNHPGILNPLDADIVDLQPYIVYPFCPGPNLAQWISQQKTPISPRLAAEITLSLVEAVAFSHEAGVLHRDIKPANILLFPSSDHQDEFPYRVTLTDFGLAKAASVDPALSSSSLLAGTLLYVSPEQLGRSVTSASTDIYSIGVVLYELLTSKRPFESDSLMDLLRMISQDPPTTPIVLRADVPKDLNTVCMKCLEKQPELRYSSAASLGKDLELFLAGQTVHAKPKTLVQRAAIWLQKPVRKRELGSLSMAVSMFLVCWSVVGLGALHLLGEAKVTFVDAAINTVALTLFVAWPMAIAGRGLSRGSYPAALIGLFSSLGGVIVSLLSFSRFAVAFPEIYSPNPMARTVVFTMLAIVFIGIATMYAAILAVWNKQPA